jgi:hypothetical protein
MKVFLLNAPGNYFELLQEDITQQIITGKQVPGFIHSFAKNDAALKKGMEKVLRLAAINTSVII